jgi:hypothetical protein
MNRLCSQPRHVKVICLLMFLFGAVASYALVDCNNTPNSKIDVSTDSLFPAEMKTDGYKVIKIQSDLLLGQRWAIISNCSHPEWPEFALPLTGRSPISLPQTTATSSREDARPLSLVHAGDLVQLWKQESLLRIEMPGVSEESGGLGKTIRVRLLQRQADNQSAPEHFLGIVRGPSNVEIQR